MRFQIVTTASMMFIVVFWDVLPCKMIVDRRTASIIRDEWVSEDNSEQEQYKSDVCGILHPAFAPLIFQYQVLFVLLQLTCLCQSFISKTPSNFERWRLH
jgi:hypothetical protein